MNNNKPIIAAVLTMLAIYLMIAFAIWDLNAKNWEVPARVMYAIFSPIFAGLVYSGVKIESNK